MNKTLEEKRDYILTNFPLVLKSVDRKTSQIYIMTRDDFTMLFGHTTLCEKELWRFEKAERIAIRYTAQPAGKLRSIEFLD